MTEAYVLIQTEVAMGSRVAKELMGVHGVTSCDVTTGPYDVVVRIEANDLDALYRVVVRDIQRVVGITRTMTCNIVKH